MQGALSLEVIDPLNRTGKISIPRGFIVETKGVQDFFENPAKRDGKELSLCLLFQRGRCNAGARCHQVHASPEFVLSLREKAAAAKNCCSEHGDVHSCGFLSTPASSSVRITDPEAGDRLFPLRSFARTACFDSILRAARNGAEVRVPAAKICRLHTQGRCKFGKDCKNVHLCPQATPIPQEAKVTPPVPVELSCGVSNCSVVTTSRDVSSRGSPTEHTVVESMDTSRVNAHDFSLFSKDFQSLDLSTGFDGDCPLASPKYDLSEFEATIRSFCAQTPVADESKAFRSVW